MPENETGCLLCGGKAIIRHGEYPGYQEPQSFKIYHCPDCNTAFSLPRDESSALYDNIYKNRERVPGYSRYWRYAITIGKKSNPLDYLSENHEDYWSVREALSVYIPDKKSTRILEIGSGLGYLTYSLNKAGYNVTGMDVSRTAVNEAISRFGEHYICKDLFEYALESPGSFDIVILTEVIEHVSSPLEFIRALISLLKPGGRAIITTPNKSFYPAEVIWASDLPPVHCWWLSEESMKYIAGELKTGISFINFSSYYKMNYHVINMSSLKENRLPRPFFNSKGELIKEAGTQSRLKSGLQSVIISYPMLDSAAGKIKRFFKNTYGRARATLSPGAIACNERGHILCSVLHKLPDNN